MGGEDAEVASAAEQAFVRLAPSLLRSEGSEEGCLQAIGLQPDERPPAMPAGRTGWGGVAFDVDVDLASLFAG